MKTIPEILKLLLFELEKEYRMGSEIKNIEVSSKFYDKLVENLTISNTLHESKIGIDQITIYTGVGRVTVTKRD